MFGYLALICSSVAYALGLVAQSVGVRRTHRSDTVDLTLLARLATDRIYLVGFAAQIAGFVLAFFARATLPLYLVQAGPCASVGLAAVIGAVALGWRVTASEVVVLLMVTVALVLLAGAAEPSRVHNVPTTTAWILTAALVLCVVLAIPAWAARGGVPLACLAGAAFAVLAVASRPIASAPIASLLTNPLTWLTIASAVVGQAMLAAALQRSSTISAGASMDAITMVVASVAGIVMLGDQTADGRAWWVVLGLAMITAGVLAMARVGTVIQPVERVGISDDPVESAGERG
jgi:hypothetical protein